MSRNRWSKIAFKWTDLYHELQGLGGHKRPSVIEPKQAQAEIRACKVVWKKSVPIWTNLILPYLQQTIASFVPSMSSFIQLMSEGLDCPSEMTVY